MASPLRSLGSNQVVFGGMMLPVSAMVISCFMVTEYSAKAAAISPESTYEVYALTGPQVFDVK